LKFVRVHLPKSDVVDIITSFQIITSSTKILKKKKNEVEGKSIIIHHLSSSFGYI